MSEEIKKEDYGKILLSWSFPEYTKYKRTVGWYVGMIILVGLFLFYALVTSNFLFAVIIVMVITIITLHNLREPTEVIFSVAEDGIIIGTKFYPWNELKNFWIIYQPPEVKTLYFSRKGVRPIISISLQNQNPVKVRELLLKYLKEDLTQERELAGDELSRWLKI